MKKSGYEGEKVTYWVNNKDPRPAIADYFRDMLNEIGFKADIKTLDQQVYFEQIGLKRTKAQIGFTDWFQDYPHPGDFIESLLSTRALQSEVTFNQGFVSDPELDKKLDELRGQSTRGGRRRVGRARQLRREREGLRGRLRKRGVELLLLGAHGLRELRRRAPGVQERLARCSARSRPHRARAAPPGRPRALA